MTIGIAAFGPNAGLAVFDALRAVERVCWGSIGGYVTFVAITADGHVRRYETQRGGTLTLFVEGETTGVGPPEDVAAAAMAGLMSSGPDRPDPLSQYVPAHPEAGLVTGHRLANAPSLTGEPINVSVLGCLHGGASAREAVDTVLDAHPDSDAGLIAIDRQGTIYARNSDRVSRRPDLGWARRENAEAGATVEILHNAIYPVSVPAEVAAGIAIETMVPTSRIDSWITVHAGVRLSEGEVNEVIVDRDLVAQEIITSDSKILHGRQNCAAIYLGSRVMIGDRMIGTTALEPNSVVEDGRIVTMNSQTEFRVGFRRLEGAGEEPKGKTASLRD